MSIIIKELCLGFNQLPNDLIKLFKKFLPSNWALIDPEETVNHVIKKIFPNNTQNNIKVFRCILIENTYGMYKNIYMLLLYIYNKEKIYNKYYTELWCMKCDNYNKPSTCYHHPFLDTIIWNYYPQILNSFKE